MKSLFSQVYDDVRQEQAKIAQKAFKCLDEERISGIRVDGTTFWLEYSLSYDMPTKAHTWLVSFIKRKYHLTYLYE